MAGGPGTRGPDPIPAPDTRAHRCSDLDAAVRRDGGRPLLQLARHRTTPRAAAPSATWRRWPAGLVARGCASHGVLRGARRRAARGDGRRRAVRSPRLQARRSTPRACWHCCRGDASAGSTWSSTCRTGCRSSPGWSPAARSSCWCTTCTASSGRWSTRARSAGSAGGSRAGSRRGSTARCQYVAVSRATRDELRQLGVRGTAIAVVHNGTDPVVHGRGRARRRPRPSASSAGWCRTSRSSTPSTRSARAARASSRTCGSPWSAAAGGRASCTRTPPSAAPATPSCSRATSTSVASTQIYERAVGAGSALAQGGLGAGRRRGRHARHAHGGLPVGRRHPRVDRRRTLGRAGGDPGGVHAGARRPARRRASPQRPGSRSPRVQPHLHLAARRSIRSRSWCGRCSPVGTWRARTPTLRRT